MSSHIQALDTACIVFLGQTGINLPPKGVTMLFLSDGENRESMVQISLMKSGAIAVSGWRLFEQTEWPQEKRSMAACYQHIPSEE